MRGYVTKVCIVCGKEFRVLESHIEYQKEKFGMVCGKVCGPSCRGKLSAEKRWGKGRERIWKWEEKE